MAKNDTTTQFFKMFKLNSQEALLGGLFLVYFILGNPVPEALGEFLAGGLAGKAVLLVAVALLFMTATPLIGVMGLLVAIDLVRKSGDSTGSVAASMFLPSEEKKASTLNSFNQFPYTLEQEMVALRTVKRDNGNYPESSFKPLLENDHGALSVSGDNETLF